MRIHDREKQDPRRTPDEGAGAARMRGRAAAHPPPHLQLKPVREGPGFRVLQLVSRTTFTWTNVFAGRRLTYDLCPYVPLQEAAEGLLIVRIHANGMAVGQRAELALQAVSLSPEEPETAFVASLTLASIVLTSSSGEDKCVTSRLRSDLGGHLRAILHLDQSASPTAAALTLSADLITRTAIEDEECTCART